MSRQDRLGVAALAMAGIGICVVADAPPSVAAPALAAVEVALPDDEAVALPPGPHADLFVQRCTACHSAAMVTRQPPLKPEQWAAIVKKMRGAYKAPVADAEVPPIMDQLAAISAAHQTGT